MKTMRAKFATLIVAACLLFVSCLSMTGCGGSGEATANTDQSSPVPPEPKRAVEPKRAIAILFQDDDSEYSRAFREGAKSEAASKQIELKWFGFSAGSAEQQSDLLQEAIDERYMGICISPQQTDIFCERLETAKANGVAVVICEKALTGDPISDQEKFNYATTDHFKCGDVVADFIGESIDDGVVLALVDDKEMSSMDRFYGVKFGLKESKIKVVSSAKENESSEEGDEAAEAANTNDASIKRLLSKFASENEDEENIAIFATTIEQSRQLVAWKKQAGEEYENWSIFTSGSWEGITDDLKSGTISGSVLENPFMMGISTVMTAADAINGNETQGLITTGEYLVTSKNFEDSDIAPLLKANQHD